MSTESIQITHVVPSWFRYIHTLAITCTLSSQLRQASKSVFFFGVPGNKNQSQTAKYQLDICISAGPDFKLSLELIRKLRFANRASDDSHQHELEEVPIC